jgi:8-oxo-dGTP pyrophosphatase MutT (NUDIX family)
MRSGRSWKTKSSKIVYENPFIVVHEDQVVKPDGTDGIYGYMDSKSPSITLVPIDDEGNTWIVQQERYTLKRTTWEAVAGRTDNQPIEYAARRELLEETGLKAEFIDIIGELNVSNGLTTFTTSVCLARGLTHITNDLDQEDGILAAEKVPLDQISDMVLSGRITDAQSIASFFMAIAYIEKEEKLK